MPDSSEPSKKGANLPAIGTYSGLVVGWLAAVSLTWTDWDVPPYALLGSVLLGGLLGFSIGVLVRRALYAPRRSDGSN